MSTASLRCWGACRGWRPSCAEPDVAVRSSPSLHLLVLSPQSARSEFSARQAVRCGQLALQRTRRGCGQCAAGIFARRSREVRNGVRRRQGRVVAVKKGVTLRMNFPTQFAASAVRSPEIPTERDHVFRGARAIVRAPATYRSTCRRTPFGMGGDTLSIGFTFSNRRHGDLSDSRSDHVDPKSPSQA
jgi:hypothetical protein